MRKIVTKKVFCSKCRTVVTMRGRRVPRKAAGSLGPRQCDFRCPVCNSTICVPTGSPPVRWTGIRSYKYKGDKIPLYSSFRYAKRHKYRKESTLRYPRGDIE